MSAPHQPHPGPDLKPRNTWLGKRRRGFGHAFSGLKYVYSTQPNFRIHTLSAILAVALGLFFRIENWEMIAVLFAIGLVMGAEAVNTCIEWLTDVHFPNFDERARRIKDVSAAAVLIICLSALAVGLFIFGPRLWELL